MKNKDKFITNRKGSALAFIIIIFFVLSIMASTISILFLSNLTQAKKQENNLKAHYLAMSGIDVTIATLMSTVEVSPTGEEVKMYKKIINNRTDSELEDNLNSVLGLNGTSEKVTIKLKYNKDKKEFTIISQAEIKESITKELSLNLTFSGNTYKKKWN